MALKPHGFIPVVHAATEERPDEIDTLIAAEAVALALAELGFLTDIVRRRPRRQANSRTSRAAVLRSCSISSMR